MAYAFKGAMFEKMPVERLPRNTFTLDHQRLTTLDMGEIIPICLIPVNPADEHKVALSDFVRVMPMYAPIMHEIEVSFFAFYERENQLWRNFDDFFRGGDDGVTDYAKPSCGEQVFRSGNTFAMDAFYRIMHKKDFWQEFTDDDSYRPDLPYNQGAGGSLMGPGSLYDHLGLPTIDIDDYVSEMGFSYEELHDFFVNSDMEPWDMAPFKMYQDIYNEYFRDEFISEKVEIFRDFDGDMLENVVMSDGYLTPETITWNQLRQLFLKRNRAWEKDRFTSALQEPIAIPEVLMPSMVTEVELYREPLSANTQGVEFVPNGGYDSVNGVNPSYVGFDRRYVGGLQNLDIFQEIQLSSSEGTSINVEKVGSISAQIDIDRIVNSIKARVSQSSATIAQLRQRVAMMEFYEQQARGGNRIKESIMINFNAVVPDYRLDRPHYLGGFKHTLSISQVLQTSSNVGAGEDYQPLGQMAGTALGGQSGFLFREYFPEAGYIMILANIRPRSAYVNGMPKTMQRFNRLDYYWHKLANIGDEPIFNKEVYCDQLSNNTPADDKNGVFGYQTRYSEYKYLANTVHGDFKTNLKDWHLARFFDKTPKLNQDFIEIQPEKQGLNRIFNYTGDDYGHFLMQVSFDIKSTRVMEIYSVPRFS